MKGPTNPDPAPVAGVSPGTDLHADVPFRLDRVFALHEFEPAARVRLPHPVYEYIAGGAGDEHSLRTNETAFQSIGLRPRVLRDVVPVAIGQELFGRALDAPIGLAPGAYQRMMHPDGELGSARAAAKHGVPFVVSTNTTVAIEELTAIPGLRAWFQLYVQREREQTRALIARVEAAGCEAVCVTVDTPVLGLRPRQLRAGFDLTADFVLPHSADHNRKVRTPSDPGRHSAVRWDDLPWLRGLVRGRLLLKGVLHPDDAARAVAAGVDGIMVSNHGGRNLDTVVPTIDALPEIAERVGGQVPILLDGGIRRGTDVVKALARGANAVLIGRPYLYALAVAGEAGVSRCVSLLIEELRYAMALVGAPSLADLDRSLEWPPPRG